jgi:uncharacterized membrane protein YgaE (UPF0421/DUF939 family)
MTISDDFSEKEKEIKLLKEKLKILDNQIKMLDREWTVKFNHQREKLERIMFFKNLYKGFVEKIVSFEDKHHQV